MPLFVRYVPRFKLQLQPRSPTAKTMSETIAAVQTSTLGLHSLEQYEPFVGAAAIERILKKADPLRAMHLVHISSTFYGGGVTEILTPLTLMMNAMGIETGWRMIQGTPAFFSLHEEAAQHAAGRTDRSLRSGQSDL